METYQNLIKIINVEISKYPTDILSTICKDSYRTDYALVYFSDLESVSRAVTNISRAKQSGYYMGSMTANEVKFMNLKKSEPGNNHTVVLSRILEYIYLTHKLMMFEFCIAFIDSFIRYLNNTMEGYFKLDGQSKFQIMQAGKD